MRGLYDEPVSRHILVAVERGVDRYPDGLTYGVPKSLSQVRVGHRVKVPLGRGDSTTLGWVVKELDASHVASIPEDRIKTIHSIEETPPLPAQVVELARWISVYYCCPLGVALAGVLPSAVKKAIGRVESVWIDLHESGAAALGAAAGGKIRKLTNEPDGAAAAAKPARLSPAQRRILQALRDAPAALRPFEARDLLKKAAVATRSPLTSLIKSGLVVATKRSSVEAGALTPENAPKDFSLERPALTAAQRSAVDSIHAAMSKGFSQHLLFGVTGSGKTEVYLQLIELCRNAGKTAILLVPEISLTPQTTARVLRRFPRDRVALLHSGLTAAQRNQQWTMVAQGEAKIIVGARSAIFAPVPDGEIGLVLVDEEHDSSGYKQDQAPRYHGRDVAIRRAQMAGCPVLLGSATPSLESWWNATERGVSTLHRLPERAPGLVTPKVEIIDFSQDLKHFRDKRVHLLGARLADRLAHVVENGGQALMLLNRRGYANWIACVSRCGWMMKCQHCDTGMICHAGPRSRFVRCHHCLTEQLLPQKCPSCGQGVTVFGLGTQRVEEELAHVHPELAKPGAVLRVDGDTMQNSRDIYEALAQFASGKARVLVGTQIIAKGLDYPNVRLVGVVNADTAINLPDFRAAERTFQLVSQVAGRCGRGAGVAQAIVQTFQPDALAIRLAASHQFEEFARQELESRKKFNLPPYRRMARIVVRHEELSRAQEIVLEIRQGLERLPEAGDVHFRGPLPCPIARISDRFRIQLEILAPDANALQRLIASARNRALFPGGEHCAVDIDPVALL
ncbi:MAG: primosomal protein N' [Planctomycetes bacterium]|nr:primosomal protein N' [Planctomycetota bacterium]